MTPKASDVSRVLLRSESTLAEAQHQAVPSASKTQDADYSASPFLYDLNGFPAKHGLLLEQARALKSWKPNVNLMITSHENVTLSEAPSFKAVAVPPLKYCANHCYAREEGGKLTGAAFLANSTRHGFQWLLLGDDDTTFFPQNLEPLLQQYDHRKPYYFGFRIDPSEDKELFHSTPAEYQGALDECPPLGNKDDRRVTAFDGTQDISEMRKDCNGTKFQRNDWFRWGNGGMGTALSAGLLDSIPAEKWQKCIDRIYFLNSDIRLAMCLALLGHHVQELPRETTISDHKLVEKELRFITESNGNATPVCVDCGREWERDSSYR